MFPQFPWVYSVILSADSWKYLYFVEWARAHRWLAETNYGEDRGWWQSRKDKRMCTIKCKRELVVLLWQILYCRLKSFSSLNSGTCCCIYLYALSPASPVLPCCTKMLSKKSLHILLVVSKKGIDWMFIVETVHVWLSFTTSELLSQPSISCCLTCWKSKNFWMRAWIKRKFRLTTHFLWLQKKKKNTWLETETCMLYLCHTVSLVSFNLVKKYHDVF